jgi:hypothetical protein
MVSIAAFQKNDMSLKMLEKLAGVHDPYHYVVLYFMPYEKLVAHT